MIRPDIAQLLRTAQELLEDRSRSGLAALGAAGAVEEAVEHLHLQPGGEEHMLALGTLAWHAGPLMFTGQLAAARMAFDKLPRARNEHHPTAA